MSSRSKCVCVVSHHFHIEWIKFLNTFKTYDTYFVVDDNKQHFNYLQKKYPAVKILQMESSNCEISGFKNLIADVYPKKTVSAWEKAIYYFSQINREYEFIWFFEADTFFYNEQTLEQIDDKHQTEDLLSRYVFCNEHGTTDPKDWRWFNIHNVTPIKLAPPWYGTLPGALRMSSRLLCRIADYAKVYGTLFYLEAAFPTICLSNKLSHRAIEECFYVWWLPTRTIENRQVLIKEQVNKTGFFHPIKCIEAHESLRKTLI